MAPKNPTAASLESSTGVEVTKTWPNAVTPSPTPLPGTTTKKTPTK